MTLMRKGMLRLKGKDKVIQVSNEGFYKDSIFFMLDKLKENLASRSYTVSIRPFISLYLMWILCFALIWQRSRLTSLYRQ